MRGLVLLPALAALSYAGAAHQATPFALDSGAERRTQWSNGLRRWYSPEDLPALFTRTLRLSSPLPAGVSLEWIFTGPEGGVTVRVESGRVRVTQRYYDSFGLSAAHPPKARFPERTWDEAEAPLSEPPRAITLEMDHKLGLEVVADGRALIHRTCLMEMRRHQISLVIPPELPPMRITGEIAAPPVEVAQVRVLPGKRRQTIYGFGGILSAPAYARLSPEGKRRWWKLVREYNLLLHREYPNGVRLKPDLSNFDRLEDASPHYYGDNFPNGEITDFAYIREIRRLGGHVLFEFWDLPPWAKDQTHGKTPDISEYVRAMVGYCRVAKQKTGAPPDVVGIQNEVVQPAAVWHRMILGLREGLDLAGFASVKIHLPDNSNLQGGARTARAVRESAEAWKRVDWAATHVYDFQNFFEDPDGYDARIREWREAAGDKPFLSTELTVNHAAYQAAGYRIAFAQGQLYHKNLALMDAAALLYCWTLLDAEQPSFGATRALFVPDPAHGFVPAASGHQLRVFGAFSRRLREGMARVETEPGISGLLATAYEGAAGERTAILLNRATVPVRVRLDWPGPRFRYAEIASPYRENSAMAAAPEPVIEPGEILTLSTVAVRE